MNQPMNHQGVIPAITTPFHEDLSVDFDFLKAHIRWMLDKGCSGITALGSLGESATLSFQEKVEILKACVEVSGEKPVVAGIAALSTREAVQLAKAAEEVGCRGLMVLPPYVYSSDWEEMKFHMSSVIEATSLSCMLYNNPIAYKTDFLPEQMLELAEKHENLHAVKESSADVRRVSAVRALLKDRLTILVGVDDLLVEGVAAGATGWIAGLVNAFPEESVRLYNLSMAGRWEEARPLYEWFLPLLRLDTVVKFVQYIKFVQEEVGMGSARVRPPRLELNASEVAYARGLLQKALQERPALMMTASMVES
ncbi:dihydrodipicolinate synthase family protein [Deinococcus roseus]|uniref:Dihydrodipicolinate synthase family protein n=1 Tax=Deinococcus roseus TaxID=392414 RepID=A0ABQ2CX60_9DEIO|nr:dihydrodipicolinate synthase family protein [Deinococcus roseus]GGJ29701.1 dihydrodipicolinate synthase family protein [Deinococcus roseus]